MGVWITDPSSFSNHRKLDGIASLSRVSAPFSSALFFFFNLENQSRLVCIPAFEKVGPLTKETLAKQNLSVITRGFDVLVKDLP